MFCFDFGPAFAFKSPVLGHRPDLRDEWSCLLGLTCSVGLKRGRGSTECGSSALVTIVWGSGACASPGKLAPGCGTLGRAKLLRLPGRCGQGPAVTHSLDLCSCNLWDQDHSGPLPSASCIMPASLPLGPQTTADSSFFGIHLGMVSCSVCMESELSIRVFLWEQSFVSLEDSEFSWPTSACAAPAPLDYLRDSQPRPSVWSSTPRSLASTTSLHLLLVDMSAWASSQLGSALPHYLCGKFSPICVWSTCLTVLNSPVRFQSFPLIPSVREFPSVQEPPLLQDSFPWGTGSCLEILSPIYSLTLPLCNEIGLLFWKCGVLCKC